MNYLIALLAFSAVMIVLATLATVLVESIHKLLRTRSRDFDEMLTQLYKKSVQPQLDNIGVTLATEAEEFVRQVRENPAIGRNRNSLFNKYFVRTEFEELTTRQFVEQFAQTEAGQNLLKEVKTKEDRVVANTISNLSYEFERYGQAATEYFHRRAAFLSLVVAFVLAITLNVDAIRLYGTLAQDTSLAEEVVRSIDVKSLEDFKANALLKATSDEEKSTVTENYNTLLTNYKNAAVQLNDTGLPVGHKFYPYCAEGNNDPRCPKEKTSTIVQIWKPVNPLLSWLNGLLAGMLMVISSEDGWVWIFRIILTTGMIGLGAPFWYKTYRFVGQFIPGRQSSIVDSTEERRQTSAGMPQNQPVLIRVANTGSTAALTPTQPVAQDIEEQPVPSATQSRSLKPASASKRAKKQFDDTETSTSQETEVVTMRTVQPIQPTYQTQVKTGLQKGDLFNILKNTPVRNKD